MTTVYTVGYQPVDLINRSYKLVDIMNQVVEQGIPSNNLTEEIVKYLKTFAAGKEDFLLVNSTATRGVIPYCKFQNTLVYDPPYVANPTEITRLLKQLSSIIGDPNTANIYLHSLNSLRALIQNYKDAIPQSFYYNALTLLTDANKSDTVSLEQHVINVAENGRRSKFDKYAIFLGDRVDPSFFDYLNSQGVYVLQFMPYDYFGIPVDTVDAFYHANPFFQSPLTTLTELKQCIFGSRYVIRNQEVHPSILLLNPGGIHLNQAEAEFYRSELAASITTYVLPGLYKGVTLQI